MDYEIILKVVAHNVDHDNYILDEPLNYLMETGDIENAEVVKVEPIVNNNDPNQLEIDF